jgi:hypothetical protein
VKVEEITATDDVATRQAASLATVVTLARGFSLPLSANSANNGLKELLQTAEVSQKRNRVVVTARLSASMLASMTQDKDSAATGGQAPR